MENTALKDELIQNTQQLLQENGGVLDTRSPEEIERDLVAKHEEAALNIANQMKPADIAATFFQTFWPMYQSCVSRLSNKELRRLSENLVQYPLVDDSPRFSSKDGDSAFGLGMRLIDSRTIMRDTLELEKLDEVVVRRSNNIGLMDALKAGLPFKRAAQAEYASELRDGENGIIVFANGEQVLGRFGVEDLIATDYMVKTEVEAILENVTTTFERNENENGENK